MTDEEERALLIGALLAGQIDGIAGPLESPYQSRYWPYPAEPKRIGITNEQYRQFLADSYLADPPGTIPFNNVRYICIAFDRVREVRTA